MRAVRPATGGRNGGFLRVTVGGSVRSCAVSVRPTCGLWRPGARMAAMDKMWALTSQKWPASASIPLNGGRSRSVLLPAFKSS